jgi:hypothetical protein
VKGKIVYIDTTLSENWLSSRARYLSVGIALTVVSAKNNKRKRKRKIHEKRAWKKLQTLLEI